MSPAPLVVALKAGSIYFLLVAIAHSGGWHIPGLYIFFDVPSKAFQDQIIGLLAFGWCVWLFETAQRCRNDTSAQISGLLVAGVIAVVALVRITAFTDLPVTASGTGWHWAQVLLLGAYVATLYVLSRRRTRA